MTKDPNEVLLERSKIGTTRSLTYYSLGGKIYSEIIDSAESIDELDTRIMIKLITDKRPESNAYLVDILRVYVDRAAHDGPAGQYTINPTNRQEFLETFVKLVRYIAALSGELGHEVNPKDNKEQNPGTILKDCVSFLQQIPEEFIEILMV